MKVSQSESFLLPVGFYNKETNSYERHCVTDGWTGYDQEALTSPIAKKNFAAGLTGLLQRLLQRVGSNGEMLNKTNPQLKCADRLLKDMFQADRDMLLLQSLAVSGDDMCVRSCTDKCNHCQGELQFDFDIRDIEVVEWDHNQPPWLDFDLKYPLVYGSGTTKRTATKARYNLMRGHDAERIGTKGEKGEFGLLYELLAECIEFENIGRVSSDVLKLQRRSFLEDLRTKCLVSVGPVNSKTVNCHHCGEDTEARLDLSRFLL